MRTRHDVRTAGSAQIGIWGIIDGYRQQVTEACWFCVVLILFLLMGPFAAPIVVLALFNLPAEERGASEPETFQEAVHFQLR